MMDKFTKNIPAQAKRVLLFGGTFNPPHLGHERLLVLAEAQLKPDFTLILPAGIPPHKEVADGVSAEHRLAMTRLAFGDRPNTQVCTAEIESRKSNYTYLTLREIRAERGDLDLIYLLGGDSLRDFSRWKEPQEIAKNCRIAALARPESPLAEQYAREFTEKYQVAPILLQGVALDISSTECRILTLLGVDEGNLMKPCVAAYVKEHDLYAPSAEQKALFARVLEMEKEKRYRHTAHTVVEAVTLAKRVGCNRENAFLAALLHDVTKKLTFEELQKIGCVPAKRYPAPVQHAFSGALAAEKVFGVRDPDVLNAIRYHTTGRARMSLLERLLYVADCVEKTRSYAGAAAFRRAVHEDFDEGFLACMRGTIELLQKENRAEVSNLTKQALAYYENKENTWRQKN